jgi:hypothetical protein
MRSVLPQHGQPTVSNYDQHKTRARLWYLSVNMILMMSIRKSNSKREVLQSTFQAILSLLVSATRDPPLRIPSPSQNFAFTFHSINLFEESVIGRCDVTKKTYLNQLRPGTHKRCSPRLHSHSSAHLRTGVVPDGNQKRAKQNRVVWGIVSSRTQLRNSARHRFSVWRSVFRRFVHQIGLSPYANSTSTMMNPFVSPRYSRDAAHS